MMRYLGMAVLFLVVFFAIGEYGAYRHRRVRECEELLALFTIVRRELACFLRVPDLCPYEGEMPALARLGLFRALKDGASLAEAMEKIRFSLSIPEEAERSLHSYLHASGRGYFDEELRLTDALLAELETCVKKERERCDKGVRIFKTVSVSATLAVVILFL